LNPSALAPGASYTQTVQTGLPSVSPGNYFLILRVDANNDLFESNETNNTLVIAITITAPDLVGTALGPAAGVAGQLVTLSWTVKNQGSGSAPIASWFDNVYLSTDNVFDNGDTLVASALNPSALAPGASYTQTVQTSLPTLRPANLFLILRVDAPND